jgi:hypothetical protein
LPLVGCAVAKAANSTGLLWAATAGAADVAAATDEGVGEEDEGVDDDGGEFEGVEPGGLDSVSAMTFATPAMCRISDTNSAIKANCRRCLPAIYNLILAHFLQYTTRIYCLN